MVMFLASFASASYITMQTTAVTNSTGGTINVTNNGDESAYKVQILSSILDDSYKSEIRDELKVGETFIANIPFNLRDKPAGIYSLLVTVNYQDSNGHLFSALVSRLVETVLLSRSEIGVELNDAEITDSVKVPVKVTNFGEEKREVSVFLFMSSEFFVKDNRRGVSVAPKSYEEVIFKVENFAARPESTYSFFAIAEYDAQDGHYSSTDSGGMRVLLMKKGFFSPKTILILSAIIAIFLIFYQFKKKK